MEINKKIMWISIVIIAMVIPLFDDGYSNIHYLLRALVSFSYTSILWNGTLAIIFSGIHRFPLIEQTIKRIFFTVLLAIAFILLATFLINFGYVKFVLGEKWTYYYFLKDLKISFVVSTIISVMYESRYYFGLYKQALLEAEHLKSENLRTQFEVLKNQVNPHFLFNNLNTLSSLIPDEAKEAHLFLEDFAKVYRYVLQNQEKDTIFLTEEIDFAKAYIYMFQIRFGKNLTFELHLQTNYETKKLAPLSLQILLENIIKHNVISSSKALHVRIYTDETNENLFIENTLNPKLSKPMSTGLGLKNLRLRYQFLGQKDIFVSNNVDKFVVKIPLF